MLDGNNVTEITKEVLKTEEKNRPWVLSLVINVLLFIAVLYCISREKKANDEKIEAERKVALIQDKLAEKGEDCLDDIREAEKAKDLYYTAKIDAITALYQGDLKSRADKLDMQLDSYLKQTTKLKNQAKQANIIAKSNNK